MQWNSSLYFIKEGRGTYFCSSHSLAVTVSQLPIDPVLRVSEPEKLFLSLLNLEGRCQRDSPFTADIVLVLRHQKSSPILSLAPLSLSLCAEGLWLSEQVEVATTRVREKKNYPQEKGLIHKYIN